MAIEMRGVVVVGLLALCACGGGGPATPKVSKVENSDGSSQLFTYSADKLSSAKSIDKDGKVTVEKTYQYTDDRITSVSAKVAGSSNPAVTTYTYTDKRLSTAVFKWKLVMGTTEYDYTVTTNYTYSAGQLTKSEESTVIAYEDTTLGVEGESRSSTTNEFTYTTDGLLQRETETTKSSDETTVSTTEFSYDSARKLVSATHTQSSDMSVTSFSYDASGRLAKRVSGDSSATIEYDTENRVTRVIQQNGSSTTTVSYSYEVGSVTGMVPTIGTVFDMAGTMIPFTTVTPLDWMVL